MQPLKLTVLANNLVRRPGMLGEHGLAFWLEAGGRRLLFDTGQGLALPAPCRAVLDRFGPAARLPVSGPVEIMPGEFATGPVARTHAWERATGFFWDAAGREADEIPDDQALWVDTAAVIVTTPQRVALADVGRSLSFCRELKVPVLGVVENMSGWVCPKCGEVADIFTTGGGEQLARQAGVPFLGRIPLDPGIVASGDAGQPFTHFCRDTPSGKAFLGMADTLQDGLGKH